MKIGDTVAIPSFDNKSRCSIGIVYHIEPQFVAVECGDGQYRYSMESLRVIPPLNKIPELDYKSWPSGWIKVDGKWTTAPHIAKIGGCYHIFSTTGIFEGRWAHATLKDPNKPKYRPFKNAAEYCAWEHAFICIVVDKNSYTPKVTETGLYMNGGNFSWGELVGLKTVSGHVVGVEVNDGA